MIRPEVESIVAAALELPHAARAAFIDARCGGHAALGQSVVSLLAACEAAGDSFSKHVDRVVVDAASTSIDLAPERVGVPGFRLIRLLGRGGMGVVYLAEQERPRRLVAVKIVLDASPSMMARLDREGEVLARLTHPGIAQVFVAGTAETPSGLRPFIAMELVEGRPLDEHCTDTKRDIHQRVELLAQVCDAVGHAHQRGIVHRDLKPANILVTGDGRPKVLDFGIARALDPLMIMASATQSGVIVGTLRYMSPEQAAGAADAVDARSDVYSLGVIVWEILSGRALLDIESASLPAALRMIASVAPPALSKCRLQLGTDVDTVVQKAMARSSADRFADADELSRALRGMRIGKHRFGPSRRWLAVGAAASAVAALALVWPILMTGLWSRPSNGAGSQAPPTSTRSTTPSFVFPGFNDEVRALLPAKWKGRDVIFAGGRFTTCGGDPMRHVAMWDGQKWIALGPGLDGRVWSLTEFDDGDGPAVFAAGEFTGGVARWNGAAWDVVAGGVDGRAVTLAVFDDGRGPALFVGGDFHLAGEAKAHFLAKWDGHEWTGVGGGADNDVRALLAFDNGRGPALYVGGDFNMVGGEPCNKIARWDGRAWSALGAGMNNDVKALAALDLGQGPRLFAGGAFTEAGGDLAEHIAQWDGSRWHGLDSGMNNDVLAMAVVHVDGNPRLLAGGQFTTTRNGPLAFIAGWDGSAWRPSGTVNASVIDIVVPPDGHALIVGEFTEADGHACGRIERR